MPKWSKEITSRQCKCRYCGKPIKIGRKAIFLRDLNIRDLSSIAFHENCIANDKNIIDNTIDPKFSPVEWAKKKKLAPSIGANVVTETSLQVDPLEFNCDAEYIHSRKSSEGNFRGILDTSHGRLWLVEHEWKIIGAYDPDEVSDKDEGRSYFRTDNL